jgi:hypothetical protein
LITCALFDFAVLNFQVLPKRTLSLEADTEAQAKVLWCLRTLRFRDAQLEAALAEIIPNVQELLEG